MKDYRPLLSNVASLLDAVVDNYHSDDEQWMGYSKEEVEALANDVTEMFNDLDVEGEGGERF